MANILAIRGGAIGDFILTLPALRLLKTDLNAKKVEILGYESIARLAVEFGFADSTRSIEHGPLAGFFNPKGKLDPDLCEYFSSFNLIVSWIYDPDGFFHGNLDRAGAETVIQASHRVDEAANAPAAAQLAKPLEQIALYPEKPWVSLGLDREPGAVIALHPGSGSPLKNWGYENWAETARRLRTAHPDHEFLVISGEAETETISDFIEMLEAAKIPFRHADSPPLPDLARELARCTIFLGHDSGISHLAGAVGLPCVLVFGPTDPQIWAPQNPAVQTVRAPTKSMAAVTPTQIVDRASNILRNPK
ncbi:MAG: heptosyltransferase-3 [Verrucomicrobiales bacterium]|jgi:heptosyltransferase-3